MATTDPTGGPFETDSLGTLEWVGILFAAVSGVIHLVIGVPGLPSGLAVSFVLAGLGFAGAIALLVVGWRRRLVYAAGVPFVGAQIVAWYALNGFPIDTVEAIDKVAQVGLIAVCLYLLATE